MSLLAIFQDIIGSIVFPGVPWSVNSSGAGPALGALLASGVYKVLKGLDYQEVNPNQDQDSTPSFPAESGARPSLLMKAGSSEKGEGATTSQEPSMGTIV